MSKLDDLGAWRAFLMFAKTGSLTAAAQSLNVDASVVSRAILHLKSRLAANSSTIPCGRCSSRKPEKLLSNAWDRSSRHTTA